MGLVDVASTTTFLEWYFNGTRRLNICLECPFKDRINWSNVTPDRGFRRPLLNLSLKGIRGTPIILHVRIFEIPLTLRKKRNTHIRDAELHVLKYFRVKIKGQLMAKIT